MNYTDFGEVFSDDCVGQRFGSDEQLEIIGWAHRGKDGKKLYLVKCEECIKDPELFGEGLFISGRSNLVKGQIPCGCSKKPIWTKEQLIIRLRRKAIDSGYSFIGLSEEYNKALTKISVSCDAHGIWEGMHAANFLQGQGCPECAKDVRVEKLSDHNTKPDSYFIDKFYKTGQYDNVINFEKVYINNEVDYSRHVWSYTCSDCGVDTLSYAHVLLRGGKSCDCSSRTQKQAYIKLLKDNDLTVAIKFGIANKASQRKIRKCVYDIENHSFWEFESRVNCIKAESLCKSELTCEVLSRNDMPDGYTETTSPLNIERIVEIFKSFGGRPLEVFI